MNARPAHLPTLLALVVMFTTALTSAGVNAPSHYADENPAQFLRLGHGNTAFPFLVAANADLYNLPRAIRRAIVLVQNAEQPLPAHALSSDGETLVIAPLFLDASDPRTQADLPAWTHASWSRGGISTIGLDGIGALTVLDNLVDYLEQPQHFPSLHEIVMHGQDVGIDLLRLHARYQQQEQRPRSSALEIRYQLPGAAPIDQR